MKGKKILCQVGVRKLGYTGASVARFLGMTTSSVNRMAKLEEMEKGTVLFNFNDNFEKIEPSPFDYLKS